MTKTNQKIINLINMISDMFCIFISYFIAVYIRFDIFTGVPSIDFTTPELTVITAMYSVIVVMIYYIWRMYGTYRFKKIVSEIACILMINGSGVVCYMAVLYIFHVLHFSRLLLFIFWGVSSAAVIAKRVIGRYILHHFNMLGYSQKRVAIIGNGHLAQQCISDIKLKSDTHIEVVGYVSAVPKDNMGNCLGCYEDLERIINEYDIDELIVALESHEIQYMKNIISCADKEGTRISLIPFFNDYFPNHVRMNIIGKTRLIDMRVTPLDNLAYAMLKRLMDIVGSAVLIILTSPIMVIAAAGVKLSSPGPVLFKQDRIGLNKKPFKMLKFRSMKVNSEETTGWSKNIDPRKTRFGSFIRKYSIDELPQLFNVLKGDMSLVGPRPEIPFYVRQFKEEIPLYLVRQQVRPGMTGWAQVNGLRGDTSIESRVEYDIWYIENWSLWLDIKILFKTAFGGIVNNEVIIEKEDKKDKETV